MYAEIIEYLKSEIDGLNLFATATRGPLPVDGGISIMLGAGSPTVEFANRGKEHLLYVACNAKSVNQVQALSALEAIHNLLARMKNYPPGTGYKIINIATGTAPNFIGTESNGQYYLYGSILAISVSQKGA